MSQLSDIQRATLRALGAYWEKNPHLRLGQIVVNMHKGPDPFYISDEELLRRLRKEADNG